MNHATRLLAGILLPSINLCNATPFRAPAPTPDVLRLDLSPSTPIEFLEPVLDPRSMLDLGLGWRLWYDTFDVLLPVQDSARTLEILFQKVAEQALGPLSSKNPEHYIHVTFQYLTLEIFSQSPMPWTSIAGVAFILLWASQRGHTGMFNMRFVNAATGVTIWAHLRTHLVAAAA